MPLTPPGNSNRASAAHLLGTTSSVVLTQVEDTATIDLPNVRINGNTTNSAAASGTSAIGIGPSATGSGTSAAAVGSNVTASGIRSSAFGSTVAATATDAHVIGSQCTNALAASVAVCAGTGNKVLHLCAPTNVPQLNSNNDPVQLDRPVGTITMFDDVNAAAAQFTFTNSYINANSIILLDPQGEPTHPVDAYVATRGAGSCVIDVIKNAASTPTVPAVIHYVVFNPT